MNLNYEQGASVDLNELLSRLVAVLRSDGHLCNVLTHVGRGNWQSIENAIAAILAPRTRPSHLDGISLNVLELICDARGITGPIMRAVFFDTIYGQVGRQRAVRLKNKINRLRKAVVAAELARPGKVEPRAAVQPPSVETSSEQPRSNVTADRIKQRMPISSAAVEFSPDGIFVDAALIADGLGLDPASVPVGMRAGEIRAVCERGIDVDDGLYRLTFQRPGHRVRLIVGTDGQVRQRSSVNFGKLEGNVRQLSG